MNPTERAFRDSVDEFHRAAEKLIVKWYALDEKNGFSSSRMTKDYPFNKDFSELVLDIGRWRMTVDKELRLGPKDWRPGV